MRSFIVMAMFTASLAEAGWNNYEEVRELSIDAAGLDVLTIDAGAGSMQVRGVERLDEIRVTAHIGVNVSDDSKAQRIIEKRMRLDLAADGSEGHLQAMFERGIPVVGSDGYIALEIEVPSELSLRIDDRAGSIDIAGVSAALTIDDGSGSIQIEGAGSIDIDDGSGSIKIRGADGDVNIVDGSGSVSVHDVSGSVTVDDGSGSIRVSDIGEDFIVVDDGSGGVTHKNVRGTVDAES